MRIKLVTFDVYGTLLDWRAHVERFFRGRYVAFLQESAVRQGPEAPFSAYRPLLEAVAAAVAPEASPEKRRLFAETIGTAPVFADAPALQHLQRMALVGCAVNCDWRHHADAQRGLGLVFDVATLAEDWGAYKPHASAWDAIVARVEAQGIKRSEWLHVSAYHDFDLIPAKERGLITAFLPRPGGSDATAAMDARPDVVVSDLWQLVQWVEERNGRPVRYAVTAACRDAETAREFLHWMRYEHGPELLSVDGFLRFDVVCRSATELVCEYELVGAGALRRYLDGLATAFRAKGRERFSEAAVTFTRSESSLGGGFARRSPRDFTTPP